MRDQTTEDTRERGHDKKFWTSVMKLCLSSKKGVWLEFWNLWYATSGIFSRNGWMTKSCTKSFAPFITNVGITMLGRRSMTVQLAKVMLL